MLLQGAAKTITLIFVEVFSAVAEY